MEEVLLQAMKIINKYILAYCVQFLFASSLLIKVFKSKQQHIFLQIACDVYLSGELLEMINPQSWWSNNKTKILQALLLTSLL